MKRNQNKFTKVNMDSFCKSRGRSFILKTD